MKKLFISCPMNGRTEENIKESMKKMHKLAEIIFNQDLEVIPTYIEDKPPKGVNERIWFLCKSIELMSQADYFIGIQWSDVFKGCKIESHVAEIYGIPCYMINSVIIAPDTEQIIKEYYNSNA